jgi:hypothetical protein
MAIPLTGQFRIYPRTVSIISGDFSVSGTGVGSASPVATAAALEAYYATRLDTPADAPRTRFAAEIPAAGGTWVPAVGTYELQFSCDTSRILFDPLGVAEEIDFLSADFPMGLTMNQLRLAWNGSYTSGPGRDRQLTDISFKYFGSTVHSVVPTPGVVFAGDILTPQFVPITEKWSPNKVFKPFGFSVIVSGVVSGLLAQPQLRNDLFWLQGVYNTQQWDLSSTPASASAGNIITISDGNASLDLFESFAVYWYDPDADNDDIPNLAGPIPIPDNLILSFTDEELVLILPDDIPPGGEEIVVVGIIDSTTFDGEFPIATFNIELVDGSGVYKLVDGQAYDTYYDRGVTPVSTVNLRIPDPRVKTGFFKS